MAYVNPVQKWRGTLAQAEATVGMEGVIGYLTDVQDLVYFKSDKAGDFVHIAASSLFNLPADLEDWEKRNILDKLLLPATKDELGGVKIGKNLNIDPDGVINVPDAIPIGTLIVRAVRDDVCMLQAGFLPIRNNTAPYSKLAYPELYKIIVGTPWLDNENDVSFYLSARTLRKKIAEQSKDEAKKGVYWVLYSDGWVEQSWRDDTCWINAANTGQITYILPIPMRDERYLRHCEIEFSQSGVISAMGLKTTSNNTGNTNAGQITFWKWGNEWGRGNIFVKGYAAQSVLDQYADKQFVYPYIKATHGFTPVENTDLQAVLEGQQELTATLDGLLFNNWTNDDIVDLRNNMMELDWGGVIQGIFRAGMRYTAPADGVVIPLLWETSLNINGIPVRPPSADATWGAPVFIPVKKGDVVQTRSQADQDNRNVFVPYKLQTGKNDIQVGLNYIGLFADPLDLPDPTRNMWAIVQEDPKLPGIRYFVGIDGMNLKWRAGSPELILSGNYIVDSQRYKNHTDPFGRVCANYRIDSWKDGTAEIWASGITLGDSLNGEYHIDRNGLVVQTGTVTAGGGGNGARIIQLFVPMADSNYKIQVQSANAWQVNGQNTEGVTQMTRRGLSVAASENYSVTDTTFVLGTSQNIGQRFWEVRGYILNVNPK